MSDDRWLDMAGFPDIDPDLVGDREQVAALRTHLLFGADETLVADDAWHDMLAAATTPPDMLEASLDGFDDWDTDGDEEDTGDDGDPHDDPHDDGDGDDDDDV